MGMTRKHFKAIARAILTIEPIRKNEHVMKEMIVNFISDELSSICDNFDRKKFWDACYPERVEINKRIKKYI